MTTKATNSVLNLVNPAIDDMVLLSGTLDNVIIGASVPNVARFTFATITNVNNTVVAANGSGTLVGVTIGTGLSYNPGTLTLTGITDINQLTGDLDVPHGGTGRNFLSHGVLIGEGSAPIDSAVPGSAGTVLISNGPSNDPFFGNLDLSIGATGVLPVTHGGTGTSFLGNPHVIIGQGASAVTGAPPGVSGYPLVSQGPSSVPEFSDTIDIQHLFINHIEIRILTTDVSFYLSPGGNDGGDGSIGNPWQTLQHAYDFLTANTNFGAHTVTLNLFDGTYFGGFHAEVGNWIVQGYTGSLHYNDPDRGLAFDNNVAIHVSAFEDTCISAFGSAQVKTGWLGLQSDNGAGLAAANGGNVVTFFTNFYGTSGPGGTHTNIFDGGTLDITTNYRIFGGSNWHLFCSGGRITASSFAQPVTVTSTTTVGFNNAFVGCSDGGFIRAISGNYGGVVAVGTRFFVNSNSTVNIGGGDPNAFWPGSVGGFQSSNGVDNAGLVF